VLLIGSESLGQIVTKVLWVPKTAPLDFDGVFGILDSISGLIFELVRVSRHVPLSSIVIPSGVRIYGQSYVLEFPGIKSN